MCVCCVGLFCCLIVVAPCCVDSLMFGKLKNAKCPELPRNHGAGGRMVSLGFAVVTQTRLQPGLTVFHSVLAILDS